MKARPREFTMGDHWAFRPSMAHCHVVKEFDRSGEIVQKAEQSQIECRAMASMGVRFYGSDKHVIALKTGVS